MDYQEILNKLKPSTYKIAGGNLKIPCIFHNEVEPSLVIYPNNSYFCFGCKKSGLISDFGIKAEYTPTVKYNIKSVSPEGLSGSPELISRGFFKSTLNHFKIRYIEDTTYIPIYWNNKEIGYQARRGREFWYSEHFQYTNYLFNYDKFEFVYVTEGLTDLFRMWQNGFTNVVSCFSSNISKTQLRLLSVYPKIVTCFDNDEAGEKGRCKIDKLKLTSEVSHFVPETDMGDMYYLEMKEKLNAN